MKATYLCLGELVPVGAEVVPDAVGRAAQRHTADQQNEQHDVREERREPDHLGVTQQNEQHDVGEERREPDHLIMTQQPPSGKHMVSAILTAQVVRINAARK